MLLDRVKISNFCFSKVMSIKHSLSRRRNKRYCNIYPISELNKVYINRNQLYTYFHHFYWNLAPEWLKEHRSYFSHDMRGFGEDAFHAMWYFVFKEYKPKHVLEIGIYRGQTLSLFSLLSKMLSLNTEIHGISPFTAAGDHVSTYLKELDYYQDVKLNFENFELASPSLHKGFSTDDNMVKIINSKKWDLIYIDGNHDYEIAKHDFEICSKNISKGGLIILDDASLYTDYKPYFFSTAGHPGPSKVALEIDKKAFEEVLAVGHNRVFKKL